MNSNLKLLWSDEEAIAESARLRAEFEERYRNWCGRDLDPEIADAWWPLTSV